ncbi:MAG: exo-alpha-sialidase [Chloroflexota bacterium]
MNGSRGVGQRRASPAGLVLPVVLLVMALLFPCLVRAETGPWSTPVEISGDLGGWFPDVTADNSGNVHVVWNAVMTDAPPAQESTEPLGEQSAAQGLLPRPAATLTSALYYSRWDGSRWTKPNDIALLWSGYAARSSIAIDGSGRLHLIQKSVGPLAAAGAISDPRGVEDLWYSSASGGSAETVGAWSDLQRITRSRQGYACDIALDSRGTLHAIWTEAELGSWGLFYASSRDGGRTWSARTALEGAKPVWWYRAQLKVDGQDRLHVVWELTEPRAGGVFGMTSASLYAMSQDGGKTWSITPIAPVVEPGGIVATGQGTSAQQPAVGVDGQGHVLLVFRHPTGGAIMFQQTVDGTNWSPPAAIPGVRAGLPRPYDVYDTVTDSAGHVHLVTVGYLSASQTMNLLHSEWDGEKWGAPTVIAGTPPYPEYPRLAMSGGNRLHVVWFGGSSRGVDRDPTGIWYSTALTTAPQVAAQIAAAPTAVAPTGQVVDPRLVRPLGLTPYVGQTANPVPLSAGGEPTRSAGWLSELQRHPSYPLIVGLVPVTLLLALLVLARLGLLDLGSRGWRR